jgi:hypothetical protein
MRRSVGDRSAELRASRPTNDQTPLTAWLRPQGTAATSESPQKLRFRAVRSINALAYQEILLIGAVATVLGLRGYLELTGYPQIGGNGLHIAHMLWGGLLMLVALVLLFSFVGTQARLMAAVASGIGFGLFIDELGKFITSDNDYFFRPTVGLLYLVFVALFLSFRALEVRRPLKPEEALANAANALPDLVIGGATPSTRARALAPIEASATVGPLARAVRDFVDAAPSMDEGVASVPVRVAAWLRRGYERVVAARWFGRGIVIIFLAKAVLAIVGVVAAAALVGLAAAQGGEVSLLTEVAKQAQTRGWVAVGPDAAASLVTVSCTVIGALVFRRDRLAGLRWFRRSVVVSLLVADPITFFAEEFGGLAGLTFDLILWIGISYLVAQEVARRSEAAPRPRAAGSH